MTYSTNFDLDLADDFPVADFEALHLYLADRRQGNTDVGEAWPDYSAAANGLLYRFRAADDDVARACASLEASNSPPQPGRYQQERDLFGFVFQGLSALECLLFGVYFVGAMVDSSQVSLDVDRQDVKPRFVARTLTAAFPGEELSRVLDGLVDDTRYSELAEMRNFLSHRGAPGRAFHTGGSDHGQAHWNFRTDKLDVTTLLVPDELRARRAWLGRSVSDVVGAAWTLVSSRLP